LTERWCSVECDVSESDEGCKLRSPVSVGILKDLEKVWNQRGKVLLDLVSQCCRNISDYTDGDSRRVFIVLLVEC